MRHSEPRTLTSSRTSSQCCAFSPSYSSPCWSTQLRQYPRPTRAGEPQRTQGTTSHPFVPGLETSLTCTIGCPDGSSNCANRPQLLGRKVTSQRLANRSLSVSISKSWGNTIGPFRIPILHL